MSTFHSTILKKEISNLVGSSEGDNFIIVDNRTAGQGIIHDNCHSASQFFLHSAHSQYVNWNKHPVPFPPSSGRINMNFSARA